MKTKILVVGDFHIPFMDKPAIKKLIGEINDDKSIDTIVFNGDIMDFYHISRFPRDPKRGGDIFKETALAHNTIKDIVDSVDNIKTLVFNEGNHEFRLLKYLWGKAPDLVGAYDFLNVETMLRLNEILDDVKFYKYMEFRHPYVDNGVLITHALKESVSQQAGYTASLSMRGIAHSIVIGHTHRLGVVHKRLYNRNIVGAEGGCFSSLYPEYVRLPDWQHGYITIERIGKSKHKIIPNLII